MTGTPDPLPDRPRILCLVVNRGASHSPLIRAVREAAASGVDWIQMRDRTLEAADWLGWAETLAEAALKENPQVQILVNRRVDLALALGAQGVHLGFDALAVPDARGLLGKSMRIGCSTHGLAEIECAAKAGADYVHLAPIFDPFSKPAERASLGLEILASACQSGMPVIAQGGISAPRCPAVLAAGAAGIAVTGAILQADRPGRATALLRSALDSSG